jgi:hypothetical protein
MRLIGKLGCVVAGTAMLGGCQSFPLTSWLFKGGRPAHEQGQLLAGNSAGSLEEGRALLRDGNISAAVASLRIALLDRSTRADASNGLGVAYARLGRPDLAERYFQAAITAEPDNSKYVANLLRLQQQVLLARRPEAAPSVASAGPARAPASRLASRDMLTGPVDRVSRSEVHVRTPQRATAAPAMAVGYRDAPAAAAGGGDQVAQAAAGQPNPVTVVFGE